MNFLEQFRFEQPGWLVALLLIPLLAWLGRRNGTTGAIVFSTLSVLASLGSRPKVLSGRLSQVLLLAGLSCGILALARPQWTNSTVSRSASGIDIMLAMDVSGSMEIPDFVINRRRVKRIDAAKSVAAGFIDGRPDDRIGIVAFAGRPYVRSPITLDHNYLLQSLATLKTGEIKEDGTAIGSAVAAGATRLAAREAKSKIIVLVTDGASNSGKIKPQQAAELAAELKIRVYTIGIGTDGGRVPGGMTPEFDPETLRSIARTTGAEYYRAQTTEKLVDVFSTINELEKTTIERTESISIKELFPWPLAAALLFGFVGITLTAFSPPPAP